MMNTYMNALAKSSISEEAPKKKSKRDTAISHHLELLTHEIDQDEHSDEDGAEIKEEFLTAEETEEERLESMLTKVVPEVERSLEEISHHRRVSFVEEPIVEPLELPEPDESESADENEITDWDATGSPLTTLTEEVEQYNKSVEAMKDYHRKCEEALAALGFEDCLYPIEDLEEAMKETPIVDVEKTLMDDVEIIVKAASQFKVPRERESYGRDDEDPSIEDIIKSEIEEATRPRRRPTEHELSLKPTRTFLLEKSRQHLERAKQVIKDATKKRKDKAMLDLLKSYSWLIHDEEDSTNYCNELAVLLSEDEDAQQEDKLRSVEAPAPQQPVVHHRKPKRPKRPDTPPKGPLPLTAFVIGPPPPSPKEYYNPKPQMKFVKEDVTQLLTSCYSRLAKRRRDSKSDKSKEEQDPEAKRQEVLKEFERLAKIKFSMPVPLQDDEQDERDRKQKTMQSSGEKKTVSWADKKYIISHGKTESMKTARRLTKRKRSKTKPRIEDIEDKVRAIQLERDSKEDKSSYLMEKLGLDEGKPLRRTTACMNLVKTSKTYRPGRSLITKHTSADMSRRWKKLDEEKLVHRCACIEMDNLMNDIEDQLLQIATDKPSYPLRRMGVLLGRPKWTQYLNKVDDECCYKCTLLGHPLEATFLGAKVTGTAGGVPRGGFTSSGCKCELDWLGNDRVYDCVCKTDDFSWMERMDQVLGDATPYNVEDIYPSVIP